MGTDTPELFSHLAIPAENLDRIGIPVLLGPTGKFGTIDDQPVCGSVVIDMIQREKRIFRLATAGAAVSVMRHDHDPKFRVRPTVYHSFTFAVTKLRHLLSGPVALIGTAETMALSAKNSFLPRATASQAQPRRFPFGVLRSTTSADHTSALAAQDTVAIASVTTGGAQSRSLSFLVLRLARHAYSPYWSPDGWSPAKPSGAAVRAADPRPRTSSMLTESLAC